MAHPHRNAFEIPRNSVDISKSTKHHPAETTTNSTSSYQARPLSPLRESEPSSLESYYIKDISTPTHSPPPTSKSKSPPPPPATRRSGSSSKLTEEIRGEAQAGGSSIPLPLTTEPEIAIPVRTFSTNSAYARTSNPSTAQEIRTETPASNTEFSPSSEQTPQKEDPPKTPTTPQSTTTKSHTVWHSLSTSPNAEWQNPRRESFSEIRDIEILLFSLVLLLTIQLWIEVSRRGERETLILIVRP